MENPTAQFISPEQFKKTRTLPEVLHINEHPGLTWFEKKFIGLASKRIRFGENHSTLQITDAQLHNQLHSLVFITDPEKGKDYQLDFATVIESLSQNSPAACNLPFFPLGDILREVSVFKQSNLLSSATNGNPIQRSLDRNGNCLDLALTAGVIAELFYTNDIKTTLLPYVRTYENQTGQTKKFRHFMILWQEKTGESAYQLYITRYRAERGTATTRKYDASGLVALGETGQATIQSIGDNAQKILTWWSKK